jgi:Oxidoreductase molybdopterin binding domain
MAGRRTNLALFGLLGTAFLTGALAFGIGTGWARWALIGHGVTGVAIVILGPWKTAIARRGLRRRRPGAVASLLFSVLIAVTIVSGFLHSTGALRSAGAITAMQVHVGAALASIPFAVWHVVARRVRVRRTDLSRRTLLRTGALAGGATLAYGAAEGLLRVASLPGAERRFTGSYETGSFAPADMPITQWLDDSVQAIDPSRWGLAVTASGERREWSYDELVPFEDRARATLDCTGGWYAEQEWEGAFLSRILPDPGEARSLLVTSSTGYSRRFPASDLAHLLLATRVGGSPLSVGHGFPVRLVAPGRRGFWWVKWVTDVELSTTPWWWQPPFPLT